jgi:uncharacterized protein YhbP (UPF0306 family)
MTVQQPTVDVSDAARSFLQEQTVLTLATASSTGIPHATDLFYVTDDLDVFFWLRPDTVTARHIDENPHVAFSIRDAIGDPNEVRGLQGAGECRVLLVPEAIEQVSKRFADKYPQLGTRQSGSLSFFRLAPTQLSFIDNRQATSPAALGMDFHRDIVFSVLRELPAEEAGTVAGQLDQQVCSPDEVIVRQGAPADKFFIIVAGEVEVTREDDGRSRKLATLGPGQFFGEMAILRDTPRNATVTAQTETTLLTMDHDTFRRVVAQSLATTEDFDDVVRARLRAL